jgi:hypothetical protein
VKCKSLLWTGCIARIGETMNIYRIMVEENVGRPFLDDEGELGSV